jgi:hypothetical protein
VSILESFPFITEAIIKAGLFVPGHTFQTSLLLSFVTLKVQHMSVKVSYRVCPLQDILSLEQCLQMKPGAFLKVKAKHFYLAIQFSNPRVCLNFKEFFLLH